MLPHSDPSKWPAGYKTALINFVDNGGWLYQACHSVSNVDVNVTRFLGTGLILGMVHSNGTLPSDDNSTT